MVVLYRIILTALGGLFYRMRGGWGISFPRPFEHIAFCSIILLYIGLLPTAVTLGCFLWAVVWQLTGHGGFMDLGSWVLERSRERLEFLIVWLENKIPTYWYDALGLLVTSSVPMLPLLIACCVYSPAAIFWVVLSMLVKPIAYMFSKKVDWTPKYEDEFTARGEVMYGALQWLCLSVPVLQMY